MAHWVVHLLVSVSHDWKLHWFPLQVWPFSLHWKHSFLSSFFQYNAIPPATRDHCTCFNSLISGVKVWQSEFLNFSSLHHNFQTLVIGCRYLWWILHVVQFQCGLSCSDSLILNLYRFSRLSVCVCVTKCVYVCVTNSQRSLLRSLTFARFARTFFQQSKLEFLSKEHSCPNTDSCLNTDSC